jgi:hypothetical protein
METALKSLLELPDIRAEIHTEKGNIYNILVMGDSKLYYLNEDFKNVRNQKVNSEILKKILSENVLKIKNKDKIIYGNNLTDDLLKDSIVKFFRWLINSICLL